MARRKRGLFDPRKRSDAERFYDDTYWSYHPEEAEEMEAQRKRKRELDARVAERMRYNKMTPSQQYEYDRQRYQEWYNRIRQSLERVAETCGWEKAEAMRKDAEAHHQIIIPEVYTNNPAVLKAHAFKYHFPFNPVELSPIDLITADLFIINRWKVYTNRPEEIFWNRQFSIENEFHRTGEGTIADHATGLLWEESGSKEKMTWSAAHDYVRSLNRNHFCGFSDWRLPAFIELSTLYGSYNYIHIDDLRGNYMEPYFPPEFDEKQLVCWSCDTAPPGEYKCQTIGFKEKPNGQVTVKITEDAVWIYNFSDKKLASPEGEIAAVPKSYNFWVRAVRSMDAI